MFENLQGDETYLISQTFNLGTSLILMPATLYYELIHLDNSNTTEPLRLHDGCVPIVLLNVPLLMLSKLTRQVDLT